MRFANNLSLSTKVLTTVSWLALSWLSASGCRQVPPGQLQKNPNAAAAGAPAQGMMANAATKTTTGKGAMGAAGGASMDDAADSAKSAGMDAMTAAPSSKMAGGAPGAAAASSGGAAMKPNPKAIPACEGKADEYACDATMLYHCVNGAYEGRAQSCKTEAQCQAGLTTGQCGECDPGTFECQGVELQMCDATGTFVLAMECPSAKLCKAEKGMCDDQICREGEFHCEGDQLQTCNRDFTDWQNEGRACDPGLCSVAAMGCLECLPGGAATCSDEQTLTGCTMDGKLDPKPCAKETPICSEAKCVQCVEASDCGEPMNECGTLTCNAGTCVPGDPKPKGTSCSGGKMCDYLGSCVVCATDLDCNDSTKRCFLQSACVTKNAITATPLLTTISVTVSPGFYAEVTNIVGTTRIGGVPPGDRLNSSAATDVTYLLSVDSYNACGFTQIAGMDGDSIVLGFAKAPDSMNMTGGNCALPDVSFRLVAHASSKP